MGKPNIKKNFIYNIIYQILAIIIPLITSPYLSRVLGAEKIGINSWTYSVVFYFMIFAVLGVNNYGNRSIASARVDNKSLSATFWSIYVCQISTSILMIFLYIVYIIFFVKQYKLIAALQIFYIIGNAVDVTWFFYGMEEFRVTVTRNSLVKLAGLVLIFTLVKTPNDLWKYTFIVSGTAFLGNALLWPFVLKNVRLYIPQFSEIKQHIKPICVLFIPMLAISIFANMDKYMIGRMSNVIQSGYYENANKIIEIPKAVITALGTVMLPRTANLIASGQEEKSKEYIENTMVYTTVLGSAFVFGMAAVAKVFSVVFWGVEFEPCGQLIAVMSPAILFSVFGNVIRTQYLIPRSMDKEYTISLIIGAVTNFGINAVLIPHFGALGATVATVISEFIMTFFQTWFVRKKLNIKQYISDGKVFLIFGFSMFFVVSRMEHFLDHSIVTLLFMVFCGAVVYMAQIFIYFRFSRKKSIQRIWKMIMSRNR